MNHFLGSFFHCQNNSTVITKQTIFFFPFRIFRCSRVGILVATYENHSCKRAPSVTDTFFASLEYPLTKASTLLLE